ncbi:unnamed protein product, partial [Heterosigma akashiwo]
QLWQYSSIVFVLLVRVWYKTFLNSCSILEEEVAMLKTIFNFGGPGWFADVFELEIVLDKQCEVDDPGDPFVLPWNAWTGKCFLFETTDVITGIVKITSP